VVDVGVNFFDPENKVKMGKKQKITQNLCASESGWRGGHKNFQPKKSKIGNKQQTNFLVQRYLFFGVCSKKG